METREAGAGDPSRRRVRVLMVEDDVIVAMTFKQQLEALGYDVVATARDGDTGVALAEKLLPDVVVMDIGLPGRTGVEATRDILSQVPAKVIVVTAYGDDRVRQALAAGASMVLTKPIMEGQLAEAIEDVLGRTPAKPEVAHRDEC